jgi:polysaccharide export outer membrane protein
MIRLIIPVLVLMLTAQASSAQIYRLRTGDQIQISVLEDPSLNQQALIRPDGRISLPLAGTIEAAGRTPDELQATIRSRLGREFVTPPTVTVSVVQISPEAEEEIEAAGLASIYVLGQVRSPGVYEVEPPINLLQLLALTGGPDIFAARDRIQVRRRTSGGEAVFLFDYDLIEDGETPAQIVELLDGDVVVVPERGLFD